MSDMFTLKSVSITSDIGMALKNFRIEHDVTAKSIISVFKKSSSYISKLEKGDIRKIDGHLLIEICNFTTNTDTGLKSFLKTLSLRYTDLSDESKVIVANIDNLLVEHIIPSELITEIISYMKEYDISISQLANKINDNTDIKDNDGYSDIPVNMFMLYPNSNCISIKLSVSEQYLSDLLFYKKYKTVHRVIIEAILYSLYRVGNNKNNDIEARSNAITKLNFYHITPYISSPKIEHLDLSDFLESLNPDSLGAYKKVCSRLETMLLLTKDYGTKKVNQIERNMYYDLPFSFAFMSIDLTSLKEQPKESKQDFLDDVKKLVDKYSKAKQTMDLYE